MEKVLSRISIRINEKIYLKDPETSDLGRRIIEGSIDMIDDMGFESFNFRKLAIHINSTEASIYRYFENKYKLLLYLTSWYWGWTEYRLVFGMANIGSPATRLDLAITLLTKQVEVDNSFSHINEVKLNRIVIAEASKAYLTKEVDTENKIGAFAGYKQLVNRVSEIILEINPDYQYPHMLVSAMIEGAHLQQYFATHLPKLTDRIKGEAPITEFYRELVFNTILKSNR